MGRRVIREEGTSLFSKNADEVFGLHAFLSLIRFARFGIFTNFMQIAVWDPVSELPQLNLRKRSPDYHSNTFAHELFSDSPAKGCWK